MPFIKLHGRLLKEQQETKKLADLEIFQPLFYLWMYNNNLHPLVASLKEVMWHLACQSRVCAQLDHFPPTPTRSFFPHLSWPG